MYKEITHKTLYALNHLSERAAFELNSKKKQPREMKP